MNFKERPWYPRWLPAAGCAAVVAVAAAQLLRPELTLASFRHTAVYVLIFHAILFWVCMLCHHHLVLNRPASEARLPVFYLWIAVGGWLGSVLISVVLPLAARHTSTTATDWIVAMLLVLVALAATEARAMMDAARRRPALGAVAAVAVTGFVVANLWWVMRPGRDLRDAVRNFYGISRVADRGGLRVLEHGTTVHGQQSLHASRQEVPLAYYHPHGPLGQVFAQDRRVQRIAAVGLGAGCVAAYLQPGQPLDVYELDPDVVDIAQRYFTYLQRSPVAPHIIIGDARQSLALAGDATYDLMILDAFGGDAIPTHLLTLEAFRRYLERLNSDGRMAIHVSSRHYRLMPVLAAAARALGLHGVMRTTRADEVVAGEELPSQWVVLGRTAESVRELRAAGWSDLQQADPRQRVHAWTDQRANVLAALAAFGGQP